MPCLIGKGRSTHVLCKKDCQTGCNCCVNTAYSCGTPCCNEFKINEQKPVVNFDKICDLIKDAIATAENCLDGGISFDTSSLPAKHCRFTVSIENVTQGGGMEVYSFEDRVRTLQVVQGGLPGPTMTDDLLVYKINGVECTGCIFPFSIVP